MLHIIRDFDSLRNCPIRWLYRALHHEYKGITKQGFPVFVLGELTPRGYRITLINQQGTAGFSLTFGWQLINKCNDTEYDEYWVGAFHQVLANWIQAIVMGDPKYNICNGEQPVEERIIIQGAPFTV